jgi:hypothetical protein
MNLFGEQGKDILVKLGSQQTAKVKQGTQGFGFIFGIAPEGISNLNTCTYKIMKSGGTCSNPDPMSWFVYGTNNLKFDKITSSSAFALVKMNIPDSQMVCDQKFNIQVSCGTWSATDFFSVNVIKKGFV